MALAAIDDELEQFGIPGVLQFHRTPSGLRYAAVKTPSATATVYFQGAHLTHWQPVGHGPVLFLSRRTELAPGKAIRGGVPIAFPWFAADQKADRLRGQPGPSHGFARIVEWTLAFAALVGEDLHLTFTLGPTAMSRELGFDHFRVAYQLTIGRTLTLSLTVANEAGANDAGAPLEFEEALHTYFSVVDVHAVSVTGLEETPFVDKTDDFALRPAARAPLTFTGFTDRVYNHTAAACVIDDRVGRRRIRVEKVHSDTTVVFNPWREMLDLGAEEWHEMLCVETVNAGESTVRLEPGTTHTMQARISVEAAEAGA